MIGNLGNKDRRGRQARVGHYGRNLRISRTGGVSLRHAVRAGRVGMAVNSRHGLRLSSALGRGTQVATQNGRFILRGRYGSGPLKFNLSKSGVSASLASDVGRLNLTNPGRSSAKLFGVQVRGRKAASINAVALAIAAVMAIIQMAVVLMVLAAKTVLWLLAVLLEGLQHAVAGWQEMQANRAFQRRYTELIECTAELDRSHLPDDAARLRLLGHAAVTSGVLQGERLKAQLEEIGTSLRSKRRASALASLAEPVSLGSESTDNMDADRLQAWCLLAARLLFDQDPDDLILEHFLALDDLCLAMGEKTEAQEELLGLIAEVGGLRLTATDSGGGLDADANPARRASPARLVEPFLRSLLTSA